MTTVYTLDAQRIFEAAVEVVDPFAPVPSPSVAVAPPELAGNEVARWTGKAWEVLAQRPGIPQPESEELIYPQFTALEMLDLFTEEEQLAVVAATMQVPTVKLWYDRMLGADYVTYEDPRTEGGLQALVGAELITSERMAEIVAAMQPS